jgi:hypothetical protein
MARLTVSTRRISGLAANFRAADARLQRDARRLVAKYRDEQFELTQDLCPVGTETYRRGEHEHKPGFLRSKLRKQTSEDGLVYEIGWREEDFTEVGEPPYFLYTEFGTRFMAARPCVFPARDRTVPKFRQALGQALRASARRGTA